MGLFSVFPFISQLCFFILVGTLLLIFLGILFVAATALIYILWPTGFVSV